MDWNIFSLLTIDGLVNGSMYLLAGLGLVLVFSVTRVVFIPFGSIAVYAAFSLAAFQAGNVPATIGLVVIFALLATIVEVVSLIRKHDVKRIPKAILCWGILPLIPCALAWGVVKTQAPEYALLIASILLVVPVGPLLGRIVFQPIANASVLVLLIVALALEFVASGLALFFFGPEGIRTNSLVSGSLSFGSVTISAYVMLVILSAVVVSVLFFFLFGRTLMGKALRATSINRTGARLIGARPERTAVIAYSVASLLAGFIGVLMSPQTTFYYDSGFLIGLKSFVAAIIGGLVSYPITAIGALGVGIFERFASFWNGELKEAIVFGLLIPILLIRSWLASGGEEDEEDHE